MSTVVRTVVYDHPRSPGHPRRRHGGGSVYFRARDGLWAGAVTLPQPSSGTKQRRRTVTSRLYCEALKKLRAVRKDLGVPVLSANAPRSLETIAKAKATHTRNEWALLYLESCGVCFYCGRHANPPEKDHKIPFSRGGTDGIGNIAVSCIDCNRSKGSTTAEEFMAILGNSSSRTDV